MDKELFGLKWCRSIQFDIVSLTELKVTWVEVCALQIATVVKNVKAVCNNLLNVTHSGYVRTVMDCPHCVFVFKVGFWFIFGVKLNCDTFILSNNNSIFSFQFIDCIMCKCSQLYSKISQACIAVDFISLFSCLCLYQFLFLSVLLVWHVNILALIQWVEFKRVPAHQKYPNLVAHMAET